MWPGRVGGEGNVNAENSAGMGNVWPGTGMLRQPSRSFCSCGNGRGKMRCRVMQSDVERSLVCIGWFPLQGKVKKLEEE